MEAAPFLATAPSSGVLVVTQDFPPDRGGIQTYCREIVQHLGSTGVPVRVLCPTPERRNRPRPRPSWPPRPEPDPAAQEIADNVDRWRIHGSFLFAPMVPLMGAYLRRHPEIRTIVYAQWQSALWHLFRPTLAANYRRLCLVHGRELMKTVFGPLTRPLARRVLNTMDEVLPVSSPVKRLVQQLSVEDRRVRLLPPGVDPRRFRPLAARDLRSRLGLDGAKVVLSISRLVRRKNLDGLMRAFARVRERFPESVLVIAGEGPERERLESQAMLLPLVPGGRVPVRFLGPVAPEQLVELYNLADVFVLPGKDQNGDIEGFGLTLLEAAACERPVIAGRAGGMVDAVADGHTGLLVDPGNEQALAAGISRLLASPELARQLGRAGRVRVLQELTWNRCAERLQAGFAQARQD
jgi:phosphatidylinositol alpha-1,6-mannosyltransferase